MTWLEGIFSTENKLRRKLRCEIDQRLAMHDNATT